MHRATLLFQAAMDLAKRSTTTSDARSTIWPKNPLIDGNDLMSILKVAIELGDYDSFADACLNQNAVIPTSFFTWTKQWLKRLNTDSCFQNIELGYVLCRPCYVTNNGHKLTMMPLQAEMRCRFIP